MILIIAAFLIIFSGVTATLLTLSYFHSKKKTISESSENLLSVEYRGLFAPTDAEIKAIEQENQAKVQEEIRQTLLSRAEKKDFTVLSESKSFYDEVLGKLNEFAISETEFLSLVAYLEKNNLRTTGEIVTRFRKIWQRSFSRNETVRLIHLASLTNRAEFFLETIEKVCDEIKEEKSKEFDEKNLALLIESEFSLLSSEQRTSGAGFLVKQTTAKLHGRS